MKYLLYITLLLHTLLFAQEDVSNSVSYIQLENKPHTFSEIQNMSNKGLFVPLEADHSKFGFTDKVFWIKISLKNNTEEVTQQILELDYPMLDTIDIYQLENAKFILKKELGDHRPYDKTTFMPNPNYELTLQPLEEQVFFIKIISASSMNIGISIQSISDYLISSSTKIKWLTFYFGAILIMLMYNFLIYIITKNRSFLYYVLFHLSYIAFALSLSGVAFELFWPNAPIFNQYMIPISMPFAAAFAILFTIHFLDLKLHIPRLAKVLYVMVFITFFVAILPFIISYGTSIQIGSLITFIETVLVFFIALYLALFKKNTNSLFYFIAWSFFLIGVAISHLSNIGIVPSTVLTSFASQIGSFFEVLLLSIGLAYYYNNLRKEHDILSYSNEKLRILSNTDPLTQCYNRRYFYETVKPAITKAKEEKQDISLLMFDLDHFKKINDTYGHDVGDKVLISFVKLCKEHIRKKDIFARYGGEEFVLFLADTHIQTATKIADTINADLAKQTFECAVGLNLTVSIGISSNTFDLEALLKEADLALYKAKSIGRNTVVIYKDPKKT